MSNIINLVIFTSRENIQTISSTLSSAINAVPNDTVIDVIVNGNMDIANQLNIWLSRYHCPTNRIAIWYIPHADKANAWNQHIHTIWRHNMNSIYIDGYVNISRESINALINTLKNNADSVGSSGVPTKGASAKYIYTKMIKDGGFHGNLCAIKSDALKIMRDRNVRIPLGMYRVDALVGAFLSVNLDNNKYKWNPQLYIPLTETATWDCEEKKWYRLKDISSWIKRKYRQAEGDFENAAVKYYLTKVRCSLEELPQDIRNLIVSWKCSCPDEALKLIQSSSRHRQAMKKIENYLLPNLNDCAPILVNISNDTNNGNAG